MQHIIHMVLSGGWGSGGEEGGGMVVGSIYDGEAKGSTVILMENEGGWWSYGKEWMREGRGDGKKGWRER